MPFPADPGLSSSVLVALSGSVLLLLVLGLALGALALLLRLRSQGRTRRRELLRNEWEPLLLEVLAGGADAGLLLARVAPRDRIVFVDFLFGFAKRLRGRELSTLGELAHPFLPPVAARTRHRSSARRARAVQLLGTLGLPEYEGQVVAALDDPSPLAAMVATQSLTRSGRVDLLEPVLERLDRLRPWRRSYLSGMLARMGSGAIPLLRSTLADADRTPSVRSVAADALLSLPDPAVAETAARVAAEEDDPSLLVACLDLLAKVGTSAHRPAVLGLTGSSHFAVRSHALKALGALGGPADVPVLEAGLDDPSPWVALEAARGLMALGSTVRLEALALSGGPRASLAREVLVS
jgi:HEAT repeat protein